jgi:hypothetical protein
MTRANLSTIRLLSFDLKTPSDPAIWAYNAYGFPSRQDVLASRTRIQG